MKLQLFLIDIPLLLCLISCEDKKSDHETCENQVIIGNNEYNIVSDDQITISDLVIDENCLKCTISASGCDGNSWIVKLVAREEIIYSDPPQRDLKLSFQNNEVCTAVISKEFSFDITALEVSGTNNVFLNIVNAGEQISYEY